MKEYKVEYLIMIKQKGSFCNNTVSFNKLLETNSLISIKNDILSFEENDFRYEIQSSEVKDKGQRYFKLKLQGSKETIIPPFLELLKIIREQIYRAEGNVNILWDDISNYYSVKAYPEINKIENLMRKLITTFMLTNIGINWTNETLPTEVKSTVKRKGKDENSSTNFLHETDFIQLADFLFKSYQSKDINTLFKQLKSCHDISELSIDALKEYIPKSNWERYFKTYVNCEDDYLNKKWTRLYELRCIIAHNNLLSKNDYDETILIINELETKIREAIEIIDEIIIPVEEKEQVMESAVTSIDERIKSFMNSWREIEKEVRDVYVKFELGTLEEKFNLRFVCKALVDKGILSKQFIEDLDPIGAFRNKLVHSIDTIDQDEIGVMSNQISNFYGKYILFEAPFM